MFAYSKVAKSDGGETVDLDMLLIAVTFRRFV